MLPAAAILGRGRNRIRLTTNNTEELPCKIHIQSLSSDEIFGKVQITSETPLQHYGFAVELQGTITFPDQKPLKLLAADVNSPYLFKSAVYDHISGELEAMKKASPSADQKRSTKTGTVFPFNLRLPNTTSLPKTFTSDFVKIEYKVVVYQRNEFRYVLLEEKALNFPGYLFLTREDAELHESEYESSNNGITARLQSRKSILPSDSLQYTLIIKKTEKVLVTKVAVKLVRHITYRPHTGDSEDKRQSDVMDSFSKQKHWKGEMVSIKEKFKGKGCIPSYVGTQFRIEYVIECEVTTTDPSTPIINMSLGVVVGTRKPVSNRDDQDDEDGMRVPRFRSRSLSGASSFLSLLPPAYSNLSSRVGSLLSFQLPPHYDDVKGDDNPTE
ncbi:uncharacterized protein LOC118434663 [Folsomia candida]|uniref:Arrestin-like N-terminal domain-containing protein n=1 Tax=Folsomia candida TaxID=158441 RepID=A0A226ERF5_FOLCA|nr:uncharacterized protein LOC118434663 [Folsomia candida]OXA59788.1 hypothetical protein Fcan01_04909 [Folsomia candida]